MVESIIKSLLIKITYNLPVKIIKDHSIKPFTYRYHLCSLSKNGPGLCIHRIVASDPDRGYHDHPWNHAISFILAGGYEERLDKYEQYQRGRFVKRWTFNYINGTNKHHRIMLPENTETLTLFAYGIRCKTWGFMKIVNG